MTRSIKIAAVVVIAAGLAVLAAAAWSGSGKAGNLPDPKADESLATAKGKETVVLAGGCFWGIQAVFEHVKGVTRATAGYSGGTVKNPGYEEVSSGTTGHAESVEVVYDPSQITFGQLLKIFFSVAHDPTQLNRQGPDFGTQYRSAIFYTTPEQQRIAQAYVDQLTQAKAFSSRIVTQIQPMTGFYRAEDYHQDYAAHNPDNPYIVFNDLPKVANLKKEFPDLYVNR
ncbi:MAG TPA: peptide-methionine (S)-S-oxide reductase MsrA [Candidatus Bathyarchaeia archaeon]|nr:peptide-methionine (S)-S-oxide reductase MsrA [Candidatus Bathyarchaeia archaeon]